MKGEALADILARLVAEGCLPGVRFLGKSDGRPVWRAHVNCAGNFWAEARTARAALVKAERAWRRDGCPRDGYADLAGHEVQR